MFEQTVFRNRTFFEKHILKDFSPEEAQRILEKRKELDARNMAEYQSATKVASGIDL